MNSLKINELLTSLRGTHLIYRSIRKVLDLYLNAWSEKTGGQTATERMADPAELSSWQLSLSSMDYLLISSIQPGPL